MELEKVKKKMTRRMRSSSKVGEAGEKKEEKNESSAGVTQLWNEK